VWLLAARERLLCMAVLVTLIAAFVDLRYRQIPPDGSKLLGFSRQATEAVHDLHFVSTCLRHFGHQSVVRVHIALVSIVTSEQSAI